MSHWGRRLGTTVGDHGWRPWLGTTVGDPVEVQSQSYGHLSIIMSEVFCSLCKVKIHFKMKPIDRLNEQAYRRAAAETVARKPKEYFIH